MELVIESEVVKIFEVMQFAALFDAFVSNGVVVFAPFTAITINRPSLALPVTVIVSFVKIPLEKAHHKSKARMLLEVSGALNV